MSALDHLDPAELAADVEFRALPYGLTATLVVGHEAKRAARQRIAARQAAEALAAEREARRERKRRREAKQAQRPQRRGGAA